MPFYPRDKKAFIDIKNMYEVYIRLFGLSGPDLKGFNFN
jgi:hypothetical protein